MHVHPNGLSNHDIQLKADHLFQEEGGGLRSLLVYTLNPGNLRQCIPNFQQLHCIREATSWFTELKHLAPI